MKITQKLFMPSFQLNEFLAWSILLDQLGNLLRPPAIQTLFPHSSPVLVWAQHSCCPTLEQHNWFSQCGCLYKFDHAVGNTLCLINLFHSMLYSSSIPIHGSFSLCTLVHCENNLLNPIWGVEIGTHRWARFTNVSVLKGYY